TRRTVFHGRDWTAAFVLAVCHLDVLPRVLGIAWNWLGNLLRQVKRIVDDQIKGRPFTDSARPIIVQILTNVVNDKIGIECVDIVEKARVAVVSRIRAKSRSYEAAGKIVLGFRWVRLPFKSIQVIAIKVEGQRPEVTMVEHGRIQLVASRVIETF